MKSYLFIVLIMLFAFTVKAQNIYIDATKKISKSVTPQQIVDSLIKRFPNAKAVQYYKASEATQNGWSVNQDDGAYGEEVGNYVLSFKNKDAQYYGFFKADGTLLQSSFEEKNIALPDAVKAKLKSLAGDDYKDYTILSKTHFKKINHSDNKEYYEVTAVRKSNPKEKKTITLNANGEVLKTK
jgi:hypothetical protein